MNLPFFLKCVSWTEKIYDLKCVIIFFKLLVFILRSAAFVVSKPNFLETLFCFTSILFVFRIDCLLFLFELDVMVFFIVGWCSELSRENPDPHV